LSWYEIVKDFADGHSRFTGKYIGNRPIRLSKVKDEQYGGVDTVTVSGRKVSASGAGLSGADSGRYSVVWWLMTLQAKMLDKVRQNRGKPLDGRPVPW
jgi:hypothetical protein